MSFRQDAARLQKLANNAFCQTGVLAALADGGTPDPDKLQKALEQTAAQFESAALEVRKLCERYSTGTGGYGSRPVLPPLEIAGSVELLGYNWLHITLNTLLPHCRFQPRSGSATPSADCWMSTRRRGASCLFSTGRCW